MKNWKKCPLFLLLLVSGLVITGAGYAGEHSIYAAYSKPDGWMTPGLSLVFQGWKDGVYPWELFGNSDASQTMAEAGTDTENSVLQETQTLGNVPDTAEMPEPERKHRLHRLQIMGQVRLRETVRAVYRRIRSAAISWRGTDWYQAIPYSRCMISSES